MKREFVRDFCIKFGICVIIGTESNLLVLWVSRALHSTLACCIIGRQTFFQSACVWVWVWVCSYSFIMHLLNDPIPTLTTEQSWNYELSHNTVKDTLLSFSV